jgi:triacylglycerol lipase
MRAENSSTESVILLHGLARSSRSMLKMNAALKNAGYSVFNCNYPSRKQPIELLSVNTIAQAIQHCLEEYHPTRIHFVTHSMGGIMVRYYLSQHSVPVLGRVVMLGPPNAGSELVDRLSGYQLFALINGPAGKQLGTEPSSLPNSLGPVDYEVGIIAGNKNLNLLSSILIPGDHDGRVSTQSARLEGMADFIQLPVSHSFMMNQQEVIQQTLHFLAQGNFNHKAKQPNQGDS